MQIRNFVGQCVADLIAQGHTHIEVWEKDGVFLIHAHGTTFQIRAWIDLESGRGMSCEIPYER